MATTAWLVAGLLHSPMVCMGAGPKVMTPPKAIFFSSGPQQQLELAIRANDAPAVRAALQAGALANARGRKDATPLMIAVDAQSDKTVAILLAQGADPNPRAADGTTAVHLAVENHAVQPAGRRILDAVMRAGGDPNTRRPDGDPVLMRFIYDHDLDDLRWFRALGADIDAVGRGGSPLIVNVAMSQDWDAVWCLLELGAKYDYESSFHSLSTALKGSYPSADAPLFPYKARVWEFLKGKGIAVPPLERGPAKPPIPSPRS